MEMLIYWVLEHVTMKVKDAPETLFMDYHRSHELKIKIIRIFNTYGPNMAVGDGRVVSNFINQAINNQDITIYGDGSQTRSFMYIDDLINAMIKMMGTDKNIIGPINLGNPNEITIVDLAELVIKLTNSDSKIVFKSLPSDDPKKRNPDIIKANKILGWNPSLELTEGLNSTINYFNKINERN